jgi:hypothetical protein
LKTFELAGRRYKSFVAETLAPPMFNRSCPAIGCPFVARSGVAGSGVTGSGRFGKGVDSPNNSNAGNDAGAGDAPAAAAAGTAPVGVGETGELGADLAAALLADLMAEFELRFDTSRVGPEVTLLPGAVMKVDLYSRLGTSFISSGVSSNLAPDCTATLSVIV